MEFLEDMKDMFQNALDWFSIENWDSPWAVIIRGLLIILLISIGAFLVYVIVWLVIRILIVLSVLIVLFALFNEMSKRRR